MVTTNNVRQRLRDNYGALIVMFVIQTIAVIYLPDYSFLSSTSNHIYRISSFVGGNLLFLYLFLVFPKRFMVPYKFLNRTQTMPRNQKIIHRAAVLLTPLLSAPLVMLLGKKIFIGFSWSYLFFMYLGLFIFTILWHRAAQKAS